MSVPVWVHSSVPGLPSARAPSRLRGAVQRTQTPRPQGVLPKRPERRPEPEPTNTQTDTHSDTQGPEGSGHAESPDPHDGHAETGPWSRRQGPPTPSAWATPPRHRRDFGLEGERPWVQTHSEGRGSEPGRGSGGMWGSAHGGRHGSSPPPSRLRKRPAVASRPEVAPPGPVPAPAQGSRAGKGRAGLTRSTRPGRGRHSGCEFSRRRRGGRIEEAEAVAPGARSRRRPGRAGGRGRSLAARPPSVSGPAGALGPGPPAAALQRGALLHLVEQAPDAEGAADDAAAPEDGGARAREGPPVAVRVDAAEPAPRVPVPRPVAPDGPTRPGPRRPPPDRPSGTPRPPTRGTRLPGAPLSHPWHPSQGQARTPWAAPRLGPATGPPPRTKQNEAPTGPGRTDRVSKPPPVHVVFDELTCLFH